MGIWASITDGIKGLARASAISTDPNFASGMQFWTPGQPVFSDKNYATFTREGYKKNPTVYACINKISGAASGIQWKLYQDRDCKKTIDKHPLLDLWRKPNSSIPGTGAFIENVFGYWHIAGNNYMWAYRPAPESPPLALWLLRPDRMKAVADDTGIQDWIYGYGTNNPKIYSIADTLQMKFPGYDDDIYGLSPLQVASYFSDLQNEAMGWNVSLMQNMGRPASVFFAKGILTPEQRNQIRQEIQKKYSGKRNAGRPLILEADMDWKNMSLTPAELDFLKSFELSTRQIAAVYDIAPELIGDSAGKTFANVKEARQALYLENVLPKLDRMSDYLNSWLLPMYPDLARNGAYFTYDKKDIEALQEVYAAQEKAKRDVARADWMAGGMTLNEYREVIGVEPLDDGECLRIGSVLVSIDSLEDYADQSLTEPANPPMPVPEPLNIPGALPGTGNQPALPPGKKPQASNAPPTPQNSPTKPKKAPQSPGQGKTPQKAFYNVVEAKEKDENGVYQPDDVQDRLNQYYMDGVTHLRWVASSGCCAICQGNDMQIVETGTPFPSGHLLPPGHPNCKCYVVGYSVPELGKARRNKHHELKASTTTYPGEIVQADNTLLLQLRSLPVETLQSGATQDDAQPETQLSSGDIYRAFIQRYT